VNKYQSSLNPLMMPGYIFPRSGPGPGRLAGDLINELINISPVKNNQTKKDFNQNLKSKKNIKTLKYF